LTILTPAEYRNGRLLTGEFIGLSDSGKTRVLDALNTELSKRGLEPQLTKEFQTDDSSLVNQVLESASALKGIRACSGNMSSLMERLKSMATSEFINETLTLLDELMVGSPERRVVKIIERGPNDQLACAEWVARNLSVLPKGDDFGRDHEEDFWRFRFFSSLGFTEFIQTVVLFYIDLENAQKRRVADGMPIEGVMANPIDFPVLSNGYLRWLNYIYPALKSGLLVVNGANPLEENISRVADHFERCLLVE